MFFVLLKIDHVRVIFTNSTKKQTDPNLFFVRRLKLANSIYQMLTYTYLLDFNNFVNRPLYIVWRKNCKRGNKRSIFCVEHKKKQS